MASEQKRGDVSIRHSIRWFSTTSSSSSSDTPPPSEPTSTIVLTSPGGRFVDLRILKEDPSSPDHTSVFSPQPQPASETEAEEVKTLTLSRLDWAIAGTSTHTPTRPTIGYYGQKLILPDGRTVNGSVADLKQGKQPYQRGRWTHWVDSRVVYTGEGAGEEVADEGDMYRIPGEHNEKLTLEKGRMVNPETGREEEYEEVWGPDEEGVAEPPYVKCVVWELDNEAENRGAEGRVVRVGRWTQGILRRGNELLCERWRWVGGEDERTRWRLEARVRGYVGGEEREKLDIEAGRFNPTLSWPGQELEFSKGLIADVIGVGDPGKMEVGNMVQERNGDVWTLVEWCP
ncbi:hypothetical protein B0H65DRAFT_288837 [Neurospora tetraspora]|uniref:Protein HRI1 n=1 Tax=Neurospora tetraspora TaxID=94610 RepID=A0AAE0J9Z3_9PEZI|nr:hypothetical protein B0H65DRAFT_288837 [Neurospora tetraspora]